MLSSSGDLGEALLANAMGSEDASPSNRAHDVEQGPLKETLDLEENCSNGAEKQHYEGDIICAVKDIDAHQTEQSPIEQVALTVSTTDDPSIPAFTFRVWVIGSISCVVLMSLNTFFSMRTQPLAISGIAVQIVALPLGRLMASTLPTTPLRVPGLGWSFSLNPGPFSMKEHVLITVFANGGDSSGGDAHAIASITIIKAFYKRRISFLAAMFVAISTRIMGYGWAGPLRRFLVDPAHMWWPANLVQVSLFRALHENETVSKGMKRINFFLLFMFVSFIYYALPGYLFTLMSFFSWVCWVWPHSVVMQQFGSGKSGLGLGAFSFDWAGISAYFGSPLVAPWFTIVNIGVGFLLFTYVVIPAAYWSNLYHAQTFPIFSNKLFTSKGKRYDVTRVMTPDFQLDKKAYQSYGKLYMSTFFALSTGVGFARIASTVTHVILFNGRDLWQRCGRDNIARDDIHTHLMRKYSSVPVWWFLLLLVASISMALSVVTVWNYQFQLPWWGIFFASAFSCALTLPIGIITATTNQQPGFNVVTEFIIGYILPGKPIGNTMFKTYAKLSMTHAISFLADLKLGHYMKIPPRSMFIAQVFGTVISATTNLSVAWWMMETIENICNTELLPPDSPWTCPKDRVAFDNTVIWGLVGPKRLFGHQGQYRTLVWFFLLGAILPAIVWICAKIFPRVKWIVLINIPVMLGAIASMPPATPVNVGSWLIVGTVFNFFLYRYRKRWWQRYNYVLSAAFDAGTAFMAIFLYFCFDLEKRNIKWWGTQVDHCPLAACPTAPGIVVKGCPVF